MDAQRAQYDELLACYSEPAEVLELLKQHRPYLELMPSMRRPLESIITIPLPIVRLRDRTTREYSSHRVAADVGVLLCDPEWKVKTGIEIFIFIHQPEENFSDLLSRWRQTEILLGQEYYWVMPRRYKDILNEGAEDFYPLFVLFPDTPQRIIKGLKGAALPYICHTPISEALAEDEAELEIQPQE
ncbi:hypothetical protein [Leptolyngbya sp. FACHB-261]|uniref:hypothetical protein n=1 Tax=Leptolyngbya sp. FACHB-261 TaxID=2692806 RepID=UPI0016847127|nr:hypothetical protein [Leptolyngbya sp. FACHB-261]MBD2104730.1 hypothetical protein [Leptolyngbya sp. FACHB-261]